MSTWGILWICFFGCISVGRIADVLAIKYKNDKGINLTIGNKSISKEVTSVINNENRRDK